MKRRTSQTALAMLLATTLAGCSRLYFDWDHQTIGQPPKEVHETAVPPATATRTGNVAPHPQSASVHQRKRKRPASPSPPDMKEMSIQPDTENPQAPSATSTISMTAPGGSDSVEKAIEATSQRLARFDRNRLDGPTLATYDEANGLLNQGKQALAEKDYVAASGFAQKASVLADRLQATVTAR